MNSIHQQSRTILARMASVALMAVLSGVTAAMNDGKWKAALLCAGVVTVATCVSAVVQHSRPTPRPLGGAASEGAVGEPSEPPAQSRKRDPWNALTAIVTIYLGASSVSDSMDPSHWRCWGGLILMAAGGAIGLQSFSPFIWRAVSRR